LTSIKTPEIHKWNKPTEKRRKVDRYAAILLTYTFVEFFF
jgi:hypothetical protein